MASFRFPEPTAVYCSNSRIFALLSLDIVELFQGSDGREEDYVVREGRPEERFYLGHQVFEFHTSRLAALKSHQEAMRNVIPTTYIKESQGRSQLSDVFDVDDDSIDYLYHEEGDEETEWDYMDRLSDMIAMEARDKEEKSA